MSRTRVGPIGTKLGSFIVNDQLEITNNYFTLPQYEKYLNSSIDIGLLWLRKNVPLSNSSKYKYLLQGIENSLTDGKYTEALNQKIIELSYDVLSKINEGTRKIPNRNSPKREIKVKSKLDTHLGPETLDKITTQDVDSDKLVLVETYPGNFVLCLYVRHNDHWDILPYKYIAEKIPNFSINLQ